MRVIHVLRKPLGEGSVAANVLRHGCGALGIDACRVRTGDALSRHNSQRRNAIYKDGVWKDGVFGTGDASGGRWPANLILERGPVVLDLDRQSEDMGMHSAGAPRAASRQAGKTGMFPMDGDGHRFGDEGGASRFFKQVGGSDS